ncbi:response regulator [Pseudomonas matsuisoli]|uniref:DNA-binding response regulator n=1 Tax=Pseudomonas matsuisoli TaxID=1515666 RepID=A0A917PKT9_9PSED|nr:response regulator [Pseudomonas matsuisoli]GGJ83194.1 DNA-binding response regulator [Pseudomonas matsuisoli]
MSDVKRILVIDDEAAIRKFLRISLASQNYQVIEAESGEGGLEQAALNGPDLVILDIGLPDQDGHAVLTRLREWSPVPVLMLSVRAGEGEKVRALDAGANDYVTKPFGVQELLARVRALLRASPAPNAALSAVEVDGLRVDLAYRQVTLNEMPIALTRKEYAVLAMLAAHAGRLVTQQQLLREVWGPTHVEHTHYLRIVVGRLRQKLGDDPAAPALIMTEVGVGYRLKAPLA